MTVTQRFACAADRPIQSWWSRLWEAEQWVAALESRVARLERQQGRDVVAEVRRAA